MNPNTSDPNGQFVDAQFEPYPINLNGLNGLGIFPYTPFQPAFRPPVRPGVNIFPTVKTQAPAVADKAALGGSGINWTYVLAGTGIVFLIALVLMRRK